jgi:hypothetical protein
MKISNKTAAFGTILIIYESRPDVTVEAELHSNQEIRFYWKAAKSLYCLILKL